MLESPGILRLGLRKCAMGLITCVYIKHNVICSICIYIYYKHKYNISIYIYIHKYAYLCAHTRQHLYDMLCKFV